MFALQVANHDSYWGGPKQAPTKIQRAIKIAIIAPAVLLFIMPSFKIGRAVYRTPAFTLPDSVKQGSVFTVPADSDVTSVQLEGRSLPELKSKQPMYLVAASSVPQLDLVLNYKAPERKLSLKSLLPHFDHPSYDFFTKQIRIDPPTQDDSTGIAGEDRASSHVLPAIDTKTFSRSDGLVTASCWKEPSLEPLPAPIVRRGRHAPARSATLTAAGPGEVTQVSAPALGEKTVVVYHGGGLYSRYYGVKDAKVRKGDRVAPGQAIATADAGTWRRPASAHWDLYLGQTEINRSSFLALSSRLCDSK